MRAAIIDIGSNSIKLLIGEGVGEEIKVLEFLKNITGIGQDTFYRGYISQSIFNRTISVLENYKRIINEYDVKTAKVIATTAVREASNKDIFVDTIRRKTGLDVEVLNVGDVVYYIDAYLSYKLKQVYPIHEKNLIIAELGAGSLDMSILEKGFTLMNIGIPIGTLRLKQFKNLLAGSQQEAFAAMQEYIEIETRALDQCYPKVKVDDIILIDESYAKWLHKLQPNKKRTSDFFPLSLREAKQFLKKVTERNADVLAQKYDIPADIAETIDGYGFILNNLFRWVRKRSIYILQTSLSEALLANILFDISLSKKYNKTNQLISAAKFLCRRYGADYRHIKHVAYIAEQLFQGMKESLGLQEEDRLYLLMAAYLHTIGQFISNRAYHRHTEYIVTATNLFRLSDLEVKMIACVARYHRKAMPQPAHLIFGALPAEKQILAQKLSALLRMANTLDASHKQKVKNIEIVFKGVQEIDLVVYTAESFVFERSVFLGMKKFFEGVAGLKVNLITQRPK